jgi:hypothetical protein
MPANSFSTLLDECRRKAALSTSDLAIWFETPRTSIHNWLGGIKPHVHRRAFLDARLKVLLKVIERAKSPFPVPPFTSQYARRNYIRDVRNAATGKKLP